MLDDDGRTDLSHFDPELISILRKMADKFDGIYSKLGD